MFDNQHCIAKITQPHQGCKQPVIVALMQADRRFIKHIENAGEAGANLRGKTDALRLATGQGSRIACIDR